MRKTILVAAILVPSLALASGEPTLADIEGTYATEASWCETNTTMNKVIVNEKFIQQGGLKCVINNYKYYGDDFFGVRINAKCRDDLKSYSQNLKIKLVVSYRAGLTIGTWAGKETKVGFSKYPIKCDR